MKKLIILLFFSLLSIVSYSQTVLNFNKVYRPCCNGGVLNDFIKISDFRGALLTSGAGGALHIFGAKGDSLVAIYPPDFFEHLAPMGNGVFAAFKTNTGVQNNVKGITIDSNGVIIDSFSVVTQTPSGLAMLSFLDSYVDSLGNAVLYFYGSFGVNPKVVRAVFITINQLGQMVKYKEYGPNGMWGDIAYSQVLAKDGKFWGVTSKLPEGIMGLGMDTSDFTGERYYLFKSSRSDYYLPTLIPYKRNGYYAISSGLTYKLTQKSDIGGVPKVVDSTGFLNFPAPIWASSDSSRISIFRTNSSHPLTFNRVAENGTILFSTVIPSSNKHNIREIMMFGDGSALLLGQNQDSFDSLRYLYPWVIVRVSDMGYPYDPWRQQVVFRGVTGTAKEHEKLSITAYPNPTQDRLRFMGIAEGNIRLIDATGKELLNQTLTEEGISLAHLPRGLYRYLLTYRGKYYQGSVVRE